MTTKDSLCVDRADKMTLVLSDKLKISIYHYCQATVSKNFAIYFTWKKIDFLTSKKFYRNDLVKRVH